MTVRDGEELRQRLQDRFATASVEYQRCKIAAQKADLEGQDLAAAILRSVAESHAGQAHALARLLDAEPVTGRGQDTTLAELAAAIERSAAHDASGQEIAAAADALGADHAPDDLRAAMTITATNTQRLKGLVERIEAGDGAGA